MCKLAFTKTKIKTRQMQHHEFLHLPVHKLHEYPFIEEG